MFRVNCITIYLLVCSIIGDFWSNKILVLEIEEQEYLGSKVKLNKEENALNEILMRLKLKELDDGMRYSNNFPPANHFFKVRHLIEKSQLFDIIKLLPKGCLLHGHDFALTSYDYLYSLTYRKKLYTCLDDYNKYQLRFFKKPFSMKSCKWMLLSEMRKKNNTFDYWLQTKLSLIVDNPYNYYPNADAVSKKLDEIFLYIEPILTFKTIFEEYFYRVLENHYFDNVMYIEFRSYLPFVYDLNGKKYGPVETITIYKEVLKKFMKKYDDFQGAKLIYAPLKKDTNVTVIEEYMRVYKKIKLAHPDFVIGFDLIGNENFGIPLSEVLNILPNDIIYYFNGTETNWYGDIADSNIIDTILLGTKRIGHGYSLMKYPQVMKIVKDRDIAIEVCPISNQVFHLVSDLRNHPACLLISQGYPIIIGNDYPTFWGAKGLSYDWYLAFISFTNRKTDLRFLKQLALNSYLYNSMNEKTKRKAIRSWERRWEHYVGTINKKYSIGFISAIFNLFFSK